MQAFFQVAIDHAANPNKVSEDTVNMMYDVWKLEVEEEKRGDEQLEEEYMEKHEIPRKSRLNEYEQYVEARGVLRENWKKPADVNKLISMKIPEHLLKQPSKIHTRYIFSNDS